MKFLMIFFLLFIHINSFAACQDYNNTIQQATQEQDYFALKDLVNILESQNCNTNQLRYTLSYIAAVKANNYVEKDNITQAKTWIDKVEISNWLSKTVQGDIAAYQKDWNSAAVLYNQAYDLLFSTYTTPPEAIRSKLYKLASQALMLSEDLQLVVNRSSGQPSGIFKPYKTASTTSQSFPIPIQFITGGDNFSTLGKNNAYFLALYCKSQNLKKITLVGHTDERGSNNYNKTLSEERAKAVKDFLVSQGVKAEINTLGKGEEQPLAIENPENYTKEEIWSLNRRVELIIE